MKTSFARFAVTLLMLTVSCASNGQSVRPRAQTRSGGAPDFSLDDINGSEFRLSDHLGQSVLLLNFWATWCEPCRVEMPHLDRIQRTYAEQGLKVWCISMDGPESVSRVRSHVGRYGYAFSVLLDQESEVTQLYNPRRAAPFNALIDRSGNIVWSHEGYAPGEERELEQQIRTALAATP